MKQRRMPGAALAALVAPALCLAAAGAAAQTVDDFSYASDAEARAAWKGGAGSPEVSVARVDGRAALKFSCRFKGSRAERAYWDRAVRLDLSRCQGLQFLFRCGDDSAVSHFTFYLKSGGGWYAGSFERTQRSGWSRVAIDKTETGVEGEPAGWGGIDGLRVSAWRGQDRDAEFLIADMRLMGSEAPIVVLRADSAMRTSGEAKSVDFYTRNVVFHLRNLGIPHLTASDLDAGPGLLAEKRLVILPHNPGMPDAVALALGKFMDNGGKILCFYVLPRSLMAKAGIAPASHRRAARPGEFFSIRGDASVLRGCPASVTQNSWNVMGARPVAGRSRAAAWWHDDKGKNTGDPAVIVSDNCILMTHVLISDDPEGKQRLLLAMVGHFVPGVWEQAAGEAVERIGRFGPFGGFAEAVDSIRRSAGRDAAVPDLLAAAAAKREAAERLRGQGDSAAAVEAADAARALVLRAYAGARAPAAAGEHRAFWCHNAFGVPGMDWDEAVGRLADAGFTAVLPNMLWGGVAYYPGTVLPVAPEVERQGDPLAACVAACRKRGIRCHVWKVCWNMGGRAPRAFADRMRGEGRIQQGFDGKPIDSWLCPSHPANQELEIGSLAEVARKYDVDGVHLDYIRYPGREGCFCDGCRKRFESAIGRSVAAWPGAVRGDPDLERRWLEFRRANITKVVAGVSREVRRARPGTAVSAAVFPNWESERDTLGQDWAAWCREGYLDFVCPMDYTENTLKFESLVRQQLPLAGRVPCYPGIGLSTWRLSDRICTLMDQVDTTRRLRTGGFTVFDYGAAEAREILPLCGMGLTKAARGGGGSGGR